MKSFVTACIASVFVIVSCAPQQPPPATAEMAQRSGKSLAQLQQGHAVYINHCGRCHEHQLPGSVNTEDWHVVVPGMAWNAGLKPSDEKAVLAYLLAAKQSQ